MLKTKYESQKFKVMSKIKIVFFYIFFYLLKITFLNNVVNLHFLHIFICTGVNINK